MLGPACDPWITLDPQTRTKGCVMAWPIVAPAPIVMAHTEVFRALLENQRQFRHLQHDLTGLVVLPNKSLAHRARGISKAPELACLPELELSNRLHCQETDWLCLPYGQPYELGDALVVHGTRVAQQSGQSTLKHVQSFHRSVIHGHTPRAGGYWLTTAKGTLQGHEIGCACSLTPTYMLPPVNWQWAFAAATIEPAGHTIVQVLPIIDGQYMMFVRERISR